MVERPLGELLQPADAEALGAEPLIHSVIAAATDPARRRPRSSGPPASSACATRSPSARAARRRPRCSCCAPASSRRRTHLLPLHETCRNAARVALLPKAPEPRYIPTWVSSEPTPRPRCSASAQHAALLGAPLRLPRAAPHRGWAPPVRARRDRGAARRLRGDAEHLLGDLRRPRARSGPGDPVPAAVGARPLRRGGGRPRAGGEPHRRARWSARSRRCCCPRVEALGDPARRRPSTASRGATRPAGWPPRRRVAPPATAAEGVMVFDASRAHDVDALHAQALELVLRRAGLRTLDLTLELDRLALSPRCRRSSRAPSCSPAAARRSTPSAGSSSLRAASAATASTICDYRGALPETGASTVTRLGPAARARDALIDRLDRAARAASAEEPRRCAARQVRRAVRTARDDSGRDDSSCPAIRWPIARSSRCCAPRRASAAACRPTSSARACPPRASPCWSC